MTLSVQAFVYLYDLWRKDISLWIALSTSDIKSFGQVLPDDLRRVLLCNSCEIEKTMGQNTPTMMKLLSSAALVLLIAIHGVHSSDVRLFFVLDTS